MPFRVSLLEFGNLVDLDAHKRKKEATDEVFLKVGTKIEGGKAVPDVKFEKAEKPKPDAP